MNDSKKIEVLLIGLAECYGEALTATRLKAMSQVLLDLPFEDVRRAVLEISKDPTYTRMPLPAMIRARALGTDDIDSEAIEAANRVVEAITRCGYGRPKDAEEFIGPLGWRIVEREGGWSALCHNVTSAQIPQLKAQWRELGKAILRRARAGRDDVPPALPVGRTTVAALPKGDDNG